MVAGGRFELPTFGL